MKTWLLLLVLVSLAGCTRIDATFLPDEMWMRDCFIVPPPEYKAFTAASDIQKVRMLTETRVQQDFYLADCNSRLSKLREWNRWAKEQAGKNP